MYRGFLIIALLLVSICLFESNGSLARLLSVQNEVSPSAGPASSVSILLSAESIDKETCEMLPASCHQKNMTACILRSQSGSHGSFILVMNDEECSLKVKVILLPGIDTLKEIEIPSHQRQKVDLSAAGGLASAVVLKSTLGDCFIHMEAPAPLSYGSQLSFNSLVTPSNGAFLVIAVGLAIGALWVCYSSRSKERHGDGAPYQELEMGNSIVHSPLTDEGAEGWEQNWGSEWDDAKPVKASERGRLKSVHNGRRKERKD